MSYILQALKDSEAKRSELNREEAPATPEVTRDHQSSGAAGIGHRKLWWATIIVVLCVMVGYLFARGGLGLQKQEGDSGAADNQTAQVSQSQSVPADSAEPDLTGVKLIVKQPELKPFAIKLGPKDLPPPPKVVVRTSSPKVLEQSQPASPEPAPVVEVDPYAGLPYLRQLPPDIQRALPDLRFSVHIYSETKAARMVKLGDRMLREQQKVAPDLEIEAIIPRAVVMRYREQLFKVPAL